MFNNFYVVKFTKQRASDSVEVLRSVFDVSSHIFIPDINESLLEIHSFGTLICILPVFLCMSSDFSDRIEFEFLLTVLFFEHICLYLCCVYYLEVFSFSESSF